MTTLPADVRSALAADWTVGRPEIVVEQRAADGTRKWLLRSADGQDYEMVFIPDADRGTLCVSSQVGCTLNCRFCHTGTMRLVRNLTAAEIVGQVMLARDALGEWPSAARRARMLTNIVMMGMGEPLYNFDNVRDALKMRHGRRRARPVAAADHALDLGRGADDGARRARRSAVNLAVSLHAVTKDECATRSCRSTANTASRNCSRPAPPIPAPTMPGGSPSNMSC